MSYGSDATCWIACDGTMTGRVPCDSRLSWNAMVPEANARQLAAAAGWTVTTYLDGPVLCPRCESTRRSCPRRIHTSPCHCNPPRRGRTR